MAPIFTAICTLSFHIVCGNMKAFLPVVYLFIPDIFMPGIHGENN